VRAHHDLALADDHTSHFACSGRALTNTSLLESSAHEPLILLQSLHETSDAQ